ncbi:MAG: S-layer protein [Candidatus Micrarchaeaceae archaeon]
MKTLNAKRIAAVVAGAALLGVGLAFAGQITFQNVPIISNSGQPVVQVVIGSNAKPSDGVVAANIAAAIGNLAYTSVPVTASVNATQATSVLHVAVSSSSYTLANQQVWLNESGSVGANAGTYLFSALIGSVLNGAIVLNSPQNTKTLQGSGQYTYEHSTTIALSPPASPYTTAGFVPVSTSVTSNNNGGGASFTQFSSTSYDNIMELTSSQYSGLLSNYGGHGETEYLWLTGFPVFDQGSAGSPVNQFQLLDAGGAYQATFSTPIQNTVSNGGLGINAPINLLGQNWTILNATGPSSTVTSSGTVNGGRIYLASALVPMQTVYVGHNLTSGPWTVELTDLGQPNSNGLSPASLSILYNNVLTNTSSVNQGTTAKFNVTGHTLYVNVNQTFAGLYAYQKWAKIQLYTNVYEIQSGKVFNQTTNPGWYVDLLWTNTTSSTAAQPKALQSIVIYNSTPTTLTAGQSFDFIQDPHAYKVTFLGDTLGASSFDTVTLGSSTTSSVEYANLGSTVTMPGGSIKNVTEPAQELTATSQIPNAFSYVGQTASSVVYDLTPYKLNEVGNAITGGNAIDALGGSQVVLLYNGGNAGAAGNWITSTNPLLVTVSGYTSNTMSSPITQTLTFESNSVTLPLPSNVYNVTSIQLNRALPSTLSVSVETGIANTLATLTNTGTPGVLYTQSGQAYQSLSNTAPGNVIYNQQNGQPTNTFVLSANAVAQPVVGVGQYFTYTLGEQAVPSNSAAIDSFTVGIDNSTGGIGVTPLFQLNYSASGGSGTKNNVTYGPADLGSAFNVQAGFRSEKGSKVVSITPLLDTFNLAKAQDYLQFSVSAANSTTSPTKSYKEYGPYGVGQATNLPNVSIGMVNASISVSKKANFTVSGISNLTATPSVTSATTPVLLHNLTTTPLVVLDSQANPGSNLILIGSGYVNTLSKQLQSAYNITMTPTTQVAQAYGTNRILVAGYYANQTAAAGNTFIQQLYAQAK